jgi:hypothetical protein
MGIFGWSYPPGCSGPPDTEGPDDALADSVYDLLGDIDDAITDKVFEFCRKLRSDAYAEGYQDGKHDEAYANEEARKLLANLGVTRFELPQR